ncbi:MAG: hypothetical protein AAGE96_12015 [Cyanobacteria bacterium P01_G01_bin.19]
MISTLTSNKTLSDLRLSILQDKTRANLSRTSKQISQLKQKLDRSFSEFDDVRETLATYNFYRQLETLQQQINIREE